MTPPCPKTTTVDTTFPMSSSSSNSTKSFPYACDIAVTLPSVAMAKQIQAILSVDREIGDRVVKCMSTVTDPETMTHQLIVQVKATEARLLRVSVSAFYEYLIVCLKCYQEFGSVPNATQENYS